MMSLANNNINMHKSIVLSALALTLVSPIAASAASFSIPAPVTVAAGQSHVAGEGDVDFTRPSCLEGTITLDKYTSADVLLTAGDVAGGGAGYGFVVYGQMLNIVATNGQSVRRTPLGFFFPGQATHVKACFTPNDGVRVDTATYQGSYGENSAFSQYSRGIVQDSLPSVRYAPAISAKSNDGSLTIGSWKYTD